MIQTQIDNEAPSVIGTRHFAHLLSNNGMVTLGANILYIKAIVSVCVGSA